MLRAALVRTPEWQACDCSALAAYPEAAALLRSRESSKLRKGHLIALCFAWRYRSPLWAAKTTGGGPPGTRGAKRPAEWPLARVPSRSLLPAGVHESSFAAAIRSAAEGFLRLDPSFALPAAVRAEPLAPIRLVSPVAMRAYIAFCRLQQGHMTDDGLRLAAAARAAAAEAEEADGADDCCDWSDYVATEAVSTAEAHLAFVSTLVAAYAGAIPSVGQLSGPDLALMADLRASLPPLFRFVRAAQVGLMDLRRSAAGRQPLLSAAAAVCATCGAIMEAMVRRNESRLALMTRHGPDQHALAAHAHAFVAELARTARLRSVAELSERLSAVVLPEVDGLAQE